jgi:hypothetical protein
VQRRGWDFPHISDRDPIRTRLKSIVGETNWNYYREVWRFYRSGQFAYLLGIHEDWANLATDIGFGAPWGPPVALGKQGPLIGVGDTLFRITETFDLAGRLATSQAGGDSMVIRLEVHGLKGRMLWVDSPNRSGMEHDYRADIEAFPYTRQFSSAELVARGQDYALDVARSFFMMFGWRVPLEILKEQQAELRPSR